jgi:hypothetical protein
MKYITFKHLSRASNTIKYHIFSSIWSGCKDQFHNICQNTKWLIGDGNKINFSLHDWCGQPLVQALNIPQHIHQNLHSTVNDFIYNSQWNIPADVQLLFPSLLHLVQQITIPLEQKEDQLLWMHSTSRDLYLKYAYRFYAPITNQKSWTKLIWNVAIPPSMYFMD